MGKSPTALAGVKILPDETPPEILAKSIVDVADAARKLLNSRLSERAILLLVKDSCGTPPIGLAEIKSVLTAASRLDISYLKKQAQK